MRMKFCQFSCLFHKLKSNFERMTGLTSLDLVSNLKTFLTQLYSNCYFDNLKC